MDGENNGKPYEQVDDLGGKSTIFGDTQMSSNVTWWKLQVTPRLANLVRDRRPKVAGDRGFEAMREGSRMVGILVEMFN